MARQCSASSRSYPGRSVKEAAGKMPAGQLADQCPGKQASPTCLSEHGETGKRIMG